MRKYKHHTKQGAQFFDTKQKSNHANWRESQNNSFLCNKDRCVTDQEKFESNWNSIFGHHKNCMCDECVARRDKERLEQDEASA
jgi:hypothetical protein